MDDKIYAACGIPFKELKQYISRIDKVSVCLKSGDYETYTLISDVPDGKYDDYYVQGVGIGDAEFPLDIYNKNPEKTVPGKQIMSGIEILLTPENPGYIKDNHKGLLLSDLMKCLEVDRSFDIVTQEDWVSHECDYIRDIPREFRDWYVYGISMKNNSKLEIVVSKTLREDICYE